MSQRFLTTVTGRSPGDHVCLSFRGPDEYVDAAREYVGEGLESHEKVTFVRVTAGGLEHAVLSDVAQVGRPADGRQPVLADLVPLPGTPATAEVPAQLDRLTRAAVAEGYTGLRLLTDVNELVREPEGLRAWIRSEHLIDRFALDHPLTAVCGYDAEDLGDEVVAEAARVHPLTCGVRAPFLLRAADAGGGLALAGEVDVAVAGDLHRALLLIGPEVPSAVTVDMSEVEFIDHGSLLALDRAAHALGVTMTLVAADPLLVWLVARLGLRHVRTAAAA